jgi:hypothetical protein
VRASASVAVKVMVLMFAQRTEILGPSELGTVCGSASPCRITAPFFLLVRCFVPLFCLVAYFDVGPLFRPVVLFGCLF